METRTSPDALGPITNPIPRLSPDALRTDQAEPIEHIADLEGDLDADVEERTSTNVAAVYDLTSRFSGRGPLLDRLSTIFTTAIKDRVLGFAVLIGDPGFGKSRVIGELARVCRDRYP